MSNSSTLCAPVFVLTIVECRVMSAYFYTKFSCSLLSSPRIWPGALIFLVIGVTWTWCHLTMSHRIKRKHVLLRMQESQGMSGLIRRVHACAESLALYSRSLGWILYPTKISSFSRHITSLTIFVLWAFHQCSVAWVKTRSPQGPSPTLPKTI